MLQQKLPQESIGPQKTKVIIRIYIQTYPVYGIWDFLPTRTVKAKRFWTEGRRVLASALSRMSRISTLLGSQLLVRSKQNVTFPRSALKKQPPELSPKVPSRSSLLVFPKGGSLLRRPTGGLASDASCLPRDFCHRSSGSLDQGL